MYIKNINIIKKNSILKILLFIVVLSCCFLTNTKQINAQISLDKNENGEYCINSSEDYDKFLTDVCGTSGSDTNKETYSGETIVLTTDISVVAKNYNIVSASFLGTFNGQGHTITYSNNYTEGNDPSFKNLSLMPFNIKAGGKICNLNVKLDDFYVKSNTHAFVFRILSGGKLEGINVYGNVKCVLNTNNLTNRNINVVATPVTSTSVGVTNCSSIENSSFSINYQLDMQNSNLLDELKNQFSNYSAKLQIYQIGSGSAAKLALKNCYSKGSYDDNIKQLVDAFPNGFDDNSKSRLIIDCFAANTTNSSALNCYYDENLLPKKVLISEMEKEKNYGKSNLDTNDTFGKDTDAMKKQETYEGFDFEKKWSISSDVNEGYPYYDPRTVEVTLNVKPTVADKTWNTATSKDKNKYAVTDTYYYPYVGDNNVVVTGAEFINLSAEEQNLIEKYNITINCDPDRDVESATIDMDFLGERPVDIKWINKPTITVGNADAAEEDGYDFVINLVNATGNVLDSQPSGIQETEWEGYYEKSQQACKVILDYCASKGAFGTKENPSYENTDIWAIFTAARCGYVPFDDDNYFDNWFKNTKAYLQKLKDENKHGMKNTDRSKLILAITAIGYDPRDISSVDLLSDVGKYIDSSMFYDKEYVIHALKSAGYSSENFTDKAIEKWVHDKAAALKNAADNDDNSFQNADNSMGWQPLTYWYGKEGFDDVTEAIDSIKVKFPSIAQRATGAFCTEGFETGCPTYGNNAWNNAQAMLFAGSFGINVLDYSSCYTKNGNNVLDAVFDQINFDEGTIPGFSNYDPSQIARGLNAVVRQYQISVLNDTEATEFWDFSDVDVPTRAVNDAILALNENSSKEDIEAARELYNALDDAHKAIFNKNTYNSLVRLESKDIITSVEKQIEDLPVKASLTLQNKDVVLAAQKAYESLTEEQKAAISPELLKKLNEAVQMIQTLEKGESTGNPGQTENTEATGSTGTQTGQIFKVTSKKSTNSIKLKWTKDAEADGYIIYRYNAKTKKYKTISTVSAKKNSYTVKRINGAKGAKLAAGTKYTFKVCSYVTKDGNKVKLNEAILKTATKPVKVTNLTAKKKSSSKAVLTWKKVKGVTGYQIFLKSKNGKYTLVKTVKGAGKTRCEISKLKKNSTCRFKVRAYIKVGTQKVCGTCASKVLKMK